METRIKENEEQAVHNDGFPSKSEITTDSAHKEESPDNAELDITSEFFNPLKALYTPDYRVTEKQPKIVYQNLAAFETALKKVGIMGLNKNPKNTEASGSKEVKEETTQRRFQEHQMAVRIQRKVKSKHQRNLVTQMDQAEGPLKQLKEFIAEGRTIRVQIRREHGVKGYVEGILKMFDRHWNLLLVDVLECLEMRKYKYAEDKLVIHQEPQNCSYILKQLGIRLPQQNVKSLDRKRVEIKRNLPQLLLRGEHVVLVSAKGLL